MKHADEIFKEFKEHSISEFFKKNKQMLGYSGMVRSLVTVVHEYVTNSLDACEDAGILPDITVRIGELAENSYAISVDDNGPGIPKNFVGKALATILAGTKFHRYVQQRGQQGIGAAGCTMFSQITTGKPVHVRSSTGKGKAYQCDISIDTVHNKPAVSNLQELQDAGRYLLIKAEFGQVKYEQSEHGVYEYLRRTALTNPHAQIKLIDPKGQEHVFLRSVDKMPEKSKPAQPHPLGLTTNDLLEYAQLSASRKLATFMIETFARVTQNKVDELKQLTDIDFDKDPKSLKWDEAERLVKAIAAIKWIAPDAGSIIPIGKDQITLALRNVLNPEFMNVVERKPAIFKGGIPFVVEAAIAYGGSAGKKAEEGSAGNILRFANRVPLLFDTSGCAITEAVRSMQWSRYNIDMENQPISVLVNISSVHIPYSGVGKESIAQEDEIINEIRLAVMEAARGIQRYISGKQQIGQERTRYKTIMRYVTQLAQDLSALTGDEQKQIRAQLEQLVAKHYPRANLKEEPEQQAPVQENAVPK